jgi:NodT family efflux transporter outer membrane factor (OMF) lipoprotein
MVEYMGLKKTVIIMFCLITVSCGFIKSKLPDSIHENIPQKYVSIYSGSPEYDEKWWKEFHSDELNDFMEIAINDNFNILEAWARVEQAKAQAKKAGFLLYPQVNANVGASKTITKQENRNTVTLDSLNLGLSVSYELDLWGKIKANRESTVYLFKATREDVNAAVMSITSQIAELWVDIISINKKIKTLTEQLQINKEILKLLELRLANSMSNFLDVYQQKQAIAAIESALIPLKSKKILYEHQLALLMGKSTNYKLSIKRENFPEISGIPKTGIPADLLAMRPDIRAAGLRLKAANQDIIAAKADRLPSISITASHTYSSDAASKIFDNWIENLAANLVTPLFDAGKRKAEVERAKAVLDERLSVYKRKVITAIKEVEDALVKEKFNRESLLSKKKQLEISKKTFEEASNRYLNGLIDYLPVLREQLNIAVYKENIIQVNADILKSRIQLYKSLGGSWFDNIKSPKNSKRGANE